MSRYKYSKSEQQINNVLKYQSEELSNIETVNMDTVEKCISDSEKLLKSLGYENELERIQSNKKESTNKKEIVIPSWEKLCAEAERNMGTQCELEELFTEEELQDSKQVVKMLNREYRNINKLDFSDICISVCAGLLATLVDYFMVGIPEKSKEGLKAGPLSNYIRDKFSEKFPKEEMEKLANSKISKVPYDAQDNRNTEIDVDGLSSYYHRLLQLGHDPWLGFVCGVFDIMSGNMTTIDKAGKIVSQPMKNYESRKESNMFAAIAKQILHLKSDVTTSMGLPVPLMSAFNILQIGSIGEEEQTIAEIVQGMYYEGYDFIHFCSMSISCMVAEVVVRMGYAFKRIAEGHSIKESIPISLNREKHPKLSTMLFLGHSVAVAVNTGKVYFMKNPLAINYAQWIAFAKYSYMQLKWVLINEPDKREVYVSGKLNEELQEVFYEVDSVMEELSRDYIIIID